MFRGLRKIKISKKLLFKIILVGGLPLLLITGAKTVFDPDLVHKFMIYTAPLALLPLVIRWAKHRPPVRETDPGNQDK